MIISDNNDEVYMSTEVKNGHWYKYWFSFFFKYNIKLLSFDGENVEIIDEKNFDIKNHKFLINLRTESNQELNIWRDYLSLVESTLSTKFDIIVNADLPPEQDLTDTIEISRLMYDLYLGSSEKPLTNDYSSLTIIKTLFNIL